MYGKIFTMACLVMATQALDISSINQMTAKHPDTEMFLAQVTNPTCLTASKRNKKALPNNFNDIVAGDAKYTDPDFPADNSSLFWGSMDEKM